MKELSARLVFLEPKNQNEVGVFAFYVFFEDNLLENWALLQLIRGLESFFRCIEWRWWKNEVRSSFSSKVIPLGKTRIVRKSPFFAPKTEVFLVVVALRQQLQPSLLLLWRGSCSRGSRWQARCERGEGTAKGEESSEAKVSNNARQPLHLSLVLIAPPLSSPFSRSTLAPPLFCSFSVPRSRPRSSSRTLTLPRSLRLYSLLVSILANLLSILVASWSPYCLTLAAPPLLPRPRCVILAASPSLSHTRCLILAALPSLHHLAPTCLLHTHHTVGSDQPPLQVLLCVEERTCCIEKPPWRLPHP